MCSLLEESVESASVHMIGMQSCTLNFKSSLDNALPKILLKCEDRQGSSTPKLQLELLH